MELIIEMIIPQTTTNRAITFNPGAVVYGMHGLIWLDPHQEVGHWLVQEKFCGLNFYPIAKWQYFKTACLLYQSTYMQVGCQKVWDTQLLVILYSYIYRSRLILSYS